jgi:tetratricopeptide (TPR) repeat protein
MLSGLGRSEDALAAIDEAIAVYRGLAAALPEAFLPDLANALNNESLVLSELRRGEDALAAIEDAVEIYRGLADTRPDTFTRDLASALNNESNRLRDLGRPDDALASIEEAVNLVLPTLEQASDVRTDAGMKLVQAYLGRSGEAKRDPDPDLIQRIHAVLTTAGLVADEPE